MRQQEECTNLLCIGWWN